LVWPRTKRVKASHDLKTIQLIAMGSWCVSAAKANESANTFPIRSSKKAAEARYQELLVEFGPADASSTRNVLTARNTSGHVGVHLAHWVNSKWENSEYSAYCASWVTDDGKRQKISFGFNRYGEPLALKLACYARKNLLKDRKKIEARFKSDIEAFNKKQKRAKSQK
jgi:hypothetical protein